VCVAALSEETQIFDPLGDLVARHKAVGSGGITSVCSAHPLVLQAAMIHGRETGRPVLIEATSNQVDQTGGYTGLRPEDFRELVLEIVRGVGVPESQVVLGGDHLGPNRWRELDGDAAMAQADELVAVYAAAGFTKLHLDCSMSCRDDPVPVGDGLASARAARLVAVAERAAPDPSAVRYVIGTEVPVPGGAPDAINGLVPTSAAAAEATIEAHRRALTDCGLEDVWPRVMALVVQPGVEFDAWSVVDYEPGRTAELQGVLDGEPAMVFEAHSTDYQRPEALAALVRDHWAVLKVGPGLTFALREAVFALAAIESELVAAGMIPADSQSRLPDVIEERMLAEPGHWQGHYRGGDGELRLARRYSYSDRLRYYWPDPAVTAAERRLLDNLAGVVVPLPLLEQHLPAQYARVRAGILSPDPRALVIDHVRDVLRVYGTACSPEVPSSAADRRDARPAREGACRALGATKALSEQPTH
jgi:D-tagatose-1,6-bisphosphate aldolase subunit GatZ/KbaZ